jgi:16S rRNA processing protein RimM
MDALDPDGFVQGRIVAVHNFGAGDLIEVQPAEGESQLVPFTREAVPDVDLAARRAVVVLPRAG